MAEIKLTQGQVAIVDDADFESLSKWKWHAKKRTTDGKFYGFYALRRQGQKYIKLHTQIMGVMGVDHINRNSLDNRRSNLRVATPQQNSFNKSGTKGYTFAKARSKWQAQIRFNGKNHNLGYFPNEEEARAAYLKARKKYFGEFA